MEEKTIMMTQQQLATLANLTIRAELCNYTGREWIQIALEFANLCNDDDNITLEAFERLQNNDWENNTVARCMLNFYLEMQLFLSSEQAAK